jgi:hypothetical protein
LKTIPISCFYGSSLSVLEFEPQSELQFLALYIPLDFCGEHIEIPDSVLDVIMRFQPVAFRPLVVKSGVDSHLRSFVSTSSNGVPGGRGCFAHFSERILKRFREW